MRKLFRRIFISEDASLIREPEFFILMDAGCEPKTRGDFLHICRETKKPIKYAFITHYHWDHTHNLKYFRERFPGIKTISNHKTGSTMRFQQEENMILGETEFVVIPTPGHSPNGGDICIYLPDKRTLFSGDTIQPQGPSYGRTDFCTPIPYFHLGEEYLHSLKKLMRLEINHVITGHGMVFTKKALETTLEAAERIKEIAREVVRRNPGVKNTLGARTIFERVAEERNFHGVWERMNDPYYHECDIQGLLYWIKKFKGETS